ncbi:MAG TPA: amidohydrolase family protein [Candidatus Methylomirabilis sp.]|nr:amidohydrolase family protein [Candidatus Methylomirabilis sp.]
MSHASIHRRTFLKGAGVTALATTGVIRVREGGAQEAVPNSTGTEAPKLKAPANTADCHIHIYDPRFPPGGPTARLMTQARVAEYRLLQKRIGTTRTVVVTPSAYGTGNQVTVDAIAQLGPTTARGVAVVLPTISDTELKTLHDGGIRGIRFTLFDPKTAVTTIDMIEPLSRRVNDLGWHVQIHLRGDQIVEAANLLQRLPSPLVFDHMGRLPQPAGTDHPAFQILRQLIDKGRTWIKLSGAYQDSKVGPPSYADTTRVAQAYIKAAPQRMVWGSDWPHPTEKEKPNDAVLFDLLAEWAPDEATRHRILVENPETLYGFPKSS